jgi:hypothetical protein
MPSGDLEGSRGLNGRRDLEGSRFLGGKLYELISRRLPKTTAGLIEALGFFPGAACCQPMGACNLQSGSPPRERQ